MQGMQPACVLLHKSAACINAGMLLTLNYTAERRRRSHARIKGRRNQQAVASTAKDSHKLVCREIAEAKADIPNGSVKPCIPPLTSKGDEVCMAKSVCRNFLCLQKCMLASVLLLRVVMKAFLHRLCILSAG